MPYYDVHIYAIARVKVSCIEASSPKEAVHEAELHHLVASGQGEYAEEIEGFLVDLLDEGGQWIEGQSVFFDPKDEKQERE